MFQAGAESSSNSPQPSLPPEESGDPPPPDSIFMPASLGHCPWLGPPLSGPTLLPSFSQRSCWDLWGEKRAWIDQTLDATRGPGLCRVTKPC